MACNRTESFKLSTDPFFIEKLRIEQTNSRSRNSNDNALAEAGDVCVKPQGKWPINAHDRMMLGDGAADGHSLVVSAEKVGIRGDFAQVALPRSMAPYRAGHLYFHGGASLAEAVVPILVARLDTAEKSEHRKVVVELTYRFRA